jgi:hypothetical protein
MHLQQTWTLPELIHGPQTFMEKTINLYKSNYNSKI